MSKAISVEQINNAIQAALAAVTARTRVGECQADLEPISAVMEAILASDDLADRETQVHVPRLAVSHIGRS